LCIEIVGRVVTLNALRHCATSFLYGLAAASSASMSPRACAASLVPRFRRVLTHHLACLSSILWNTNAATARLREPARLVEEADLALLAHLRHAVLAQAAQDY